MVQETLQGYSRSHNDKACINSLPVELFVDILSRTSLADTIAASHVCQFWRDTTLTQPDLWSSALKKDLTRVMRRRSADMLQALLARAATSPVDVIMYIDSSALLEVIEAHLHHIRALDISIDLGPMAYVDMAHGQLATSFFYFMRSPAPMLENLRIEVFDYGGNTQPPAVPADLFAGMAPLRLETVTAVGVNFPHHPYAAFANVKGFAFCEMGYGREHILDMAHNLIGYEHLRHLVLICMSELPARIVEVCRGLSLRLDVLDIAYTIDESNTAALLGGDDLPPTVWLHPADHGELDRRWIFEASSPIVEVCLASRGNHFPGICATDSRGRKRQLSSVDGTFPFLSPSSPP